MEIPMVEAKYWISDLVLQTVCFVCSIIAWIEYCTFTFILGHLNCLKIMAVNSDSTTLAVDESTRRNCG